MLLLPAIGEVLELDDRVTKFRGGRPNRPYLVFRQFPPLWVSVMPLSRREESPRSDYLIPVHAVHGLDSDSFLVDWWTNLEYADTAFAPSLGHLANDLLPSVLEHIRSLLNND